MSKRRYVFYEQTMAEMKNKTSMHLKLQRSPGVVKGAPIPRPSPRVQVRDSGLAGPDSWSRTLLAGTRPDVSMAALSPVGNSVSTVGPRLPAALLSCKETILPETFFDGLTSIAKRFAWSHGCGVDTIIRLAPNKPD